MDPLTTLALVCNVFDLVERGYKCAKAFKEIYETPEGQRDQHIQLEHHITSMEAVWSEMQQKNSELAQGTVETQFQAALQRSHQVSKSMRTIILDCKAKRPGTIRYSTKAAFKSLFKQNKLQAELLKLEECREALKLCVIVQTNQEVTNLAKVLEKAGSDQQDIRRDLQILLKRFLPASGGDLSLQFDVLKARSEVAIDRFNSQRILSGIDAHNARYDEVIEASPHTYRWIYADTQTEEQLNESYLTSHIIPARDAFTSWLRAGDGIFHIAGKPGSGKSTLMKFILKTSQTTELLHEWAGSKPLVVVRFFFWKPGDWRQNTLRGLKQSIVADVLRAVPALSQDLFPRLYQKELIMDLLVKPLVEYRDIELAFEQLLGSQRVLEPYMLCLFLDGLDEFKESIEGMNHSELANQIKQLQDITRMDITSHIGGSIQDDSYFKMLQSQDFNGCNAMIKELAERADGVFLWVALVVKSIQRGLTNRDSLSKLRSRIQKTPKELGDLFDQILSEIDNDNYQRETYILLAIALTESWDGIPRREQFLDGSGAFCPFISLLAAGFLFQTIDSEIAVRSIFEAEIQESSFHVEHYCTGNLKSAAIQISARCLGLLEVGKYHKDGNVDEIVKFLHRSIPEHLHSHISKRLDKLGITSNMILDTMAWMVVQELHYIRDGEDTLLIESPGRELTSRGLRTIPRLIYLMHWSKVTTLEIKRELHSTTMHLLGRIDKAIFQVQRVSLAQLETSSPTPHFWQVAESANTGLTNACCYGLYQYVHWALIQTPLSKSAKFYSYLLLYLACMGQFRGTPGCSQTVKVLLENGCSTSSAATFLDNYDRDAMSFEVTAFDCLWLWIVGLSVHISFRGAFPAYDSSPLHISEVWSTLETFRAHGARPNWVLIWLVDKDHLENRAKSTDLRIQSTISANMEVRPLPDDRRRLSTHLLQILKAHLQQQLQKERHTRGNTDNFDGVITIEFEDVVRYFHPPNMEQILHPTISVKAESSLKDIHEGNSDLNYRAPHSSMRVPMSIAIGKIIITPLFVQQYESLTYPVVLILAILGALSQWML
ncbi:hypothetical protein VTL71DRAFT_9337 [Oculimacula yallundae]|uniref:Nephrocystin 3-like N-terminal domain-containing protein n=1 Tax=Oculimacula yallundae TaxID=86028 RepID=A0ABR4BU06_9HELO